MDAFAHEAREEYQAALEFTLLADRVALACSPAQHYFAERLNQEALSLVLHIAQAASVAGPNDRAELLHNAEHVAARCAALFDLALQLRVAQDAQADAGRGLLLKIVTLLAKQRPRSEKPKPAAPAPAATPETAPEPDED